MPRIGLRLHIFIIVVALSAVSVAVETFFVQRFFRDYVVDSTSRKVMEVASETALDARIIDAFDDAEPSAAIQPIAERIREISGASYVVVFNMDAVRYSHPEPDRIGKRFVGGDERRALEGESYVSQARGTLGLSIRAFVPIRRGSGEQLGVVSVGLLLQNLDRETRRIGAILATSAAVCLSLGLVGAFGLSNNIKKTIFGLEPVDIAALLEERNVIISSIKEGIVAIDTSGRVILINENAKRLLALEGDCTGTLVADLIPNTRLMEVVSRGVSHLDEEQEVNGRINLVNRLPLVSRGRIIGAVATFRDLSEVRALAEELTEVRKYTEALRSQHHEFLNKLHVVSGLLQLKRYEDATNFIVKTVSVKQQVFDDLAKRVKVPDVAALVLAKMNAAEEFDIAVRLSEDAFLPPVLPSAVPSVVTIVGNLLQNSIESLRQCEEERKRIELSFRSAGEKFEIRVYDNGSGIDADLLDRIFDQGVSTKTGTGNMGIGLSLVRLHARALGGDVSATAKREGAEIVVLVDKRAAFQDGNGV